MSDARPTKQVIVMRTDLNMRKGKMVAQGAHASMKVLVDRLEWRGRRVEHVREYDPEFADVVTFQEVRADVDEAMLAWLSGRFTKVCVKTKSEAELVEIYEAAKAAGLPCALIEDHGLTEFHGQVTKTCCAIGPAWSDAIDPVTGHLELL